MDILLRSAVLAFAAALAGCGGGAGDAAGPAASLQHARAVITTCAYEHVFVTVEKLVVNRGSARSETVLPQPRRIDLLALDHGLLQALGTPPLPAGHYSDVRLVLLPDSSDGAVLANAVQPSGGALTALRTPGAQHGGVKLQADFDVPNGQAADLMLEADPCTLVSKPPGAAGHYTLDPTVVARPVNVTMVAKGEFRVSISDRNGEPAVAGLPDGGYLVAWAAGGDSTMRSDVYAQRYLPDGGPLGTVTAVTAYPGNQGGPQIAVLADGGYLIAFGGSDTPRGGSVAFRRYAADGSPIDTSGPDMPPSLWQHGGQAVLGLEDGSFVFAWHSAQGLYDFDVYAQRYAANGSPLGTPTRVNASAEGVQDSPAMGRAGAGYVIAWTSQGQGDSGADVHAQWYGADGTPSGAETRVNTTTAGNQTAPAVATLANGDAMIIWVSDAPDGGQTISAQRYTAAGAPVGPEQLLVDSPGAIYWYRSIAGLRDGGYVLAWGSCGEYGTDCRVYAQRFGAQGAAVGGRTTVNTAPNARSPAVAALGDGGYVLAWSFGQPGLIYTTDIYAEQFDAQGLVR